VLGFESKLPYDPAEFDATIQDFLTVAEAVRVETESSIQHRQGTAAEEVDPVRAAKRRASRREALEGVFRAFDLDGSGWVDREELLELGVAR